jgi:hypothetical protein
MQGSTMFLRAAVTAWLSAFVVVMTTGSHAQFITNATADEMAYANAVGAMRVEWGSNAIAGLGTGSGAR